MASPPDPPKGRKRAAPKSNSSAKSKPAKMARSSDVSKLLGLPESQIYSIEKILSHKDVLALLHPEERAMITKILRDAAIRRVIAEFREDGAYSRHDPQWLTEAQSASETRKEGGYDDYLDEKFQDEWAEEDPYLSEDEDEEDTGDEDVVPASTDRVPSPQDHNRDDDHGDGGGASTSSAPAQNNASNASNGTYAESNSSSDRRSGDTKHNNDKQTQDNANLVNSLDYTPEPPPRTYICKFRSACKLTQLVDTGPLITGLCEGDVIRYRNKDAKVVSNGESIIVDIPPGAHLHSEPDVRADVSYPRASLPKKICGPSDIAKAMREQDSSIPESRDWRDFQLVRNGVEVGSLYDFRQAWQFAMNEYQYQRQLLFLGGRPRRLTQPQQDEGFQIIGRAALYRKIRVEDFPSLNRNLIIDLLQNLNDELAEVADAGFKIIMLDLRVTNKDGIPKPAASSLEGVYQHGPDSFPTPFLRALAGIHGWSMGHAHVGPFGLGKGYNSKHWGCAVASGVSSQSGLAALNTRQPHNFLNIRNANSIGIDVDPPGARWTEREITEVTQFHRTKLQGKIKHRSVPLTLGRAVPATQIEIHHRETPSMDQPDHETPVAPLPSNEGPSMDQPDHETPLAPLPSNERYSMSMPADGRSSTSLPSSEKPSMALPGNEEPSMSLPADVRRSLEMFNNDPEWARLHEYQSPYLPLPNPESRYPEVPDPQAVNGPYFLPGAGDNPHSIYPEVPEPDAVVGPYFPPHAPTNFYAPNRHDYSGHAYNGHDYNGHDYNGHDYNGNADNDNAYHGYPPNGYAPGGYASNGYAPGGYASNGYAPGGYASNGYAPAGYASNGYASNGYTPNGYASNGHASNGHPSSGYAPNGRASKRHAPNRYAASNDHAPRVYAFDEYPEFHPVRDDRAAIIGMSVGHVPPSRGDPSFAQVVYPEDDQVAHPPMAPPSSVTTTAPAFDESVLDPRLFDPNFNFEGIESILPPGVYYPPRPNTANSHSSKDGVTTHPGIQETAKLQPHLPEGSLGLGQLASPAVEPSFKGEHHGMQKGHKRKREEDF